MRITSTSILAGLLVLITGCATPAQQAQAPGAAAGTARGPKILTVAELREAATIYGFTGEGGAGSGAGVAGALVHDLLVRADPFDVLHPFVAAEVPSVERGTWRLNPDGSMDVTWKLKQGVKWQDGAPFSSADMMFTLALNKDADLPTSQAAVARLMESGTAPDPSTFVVHWNRVDIRGAEGLPSCRCRGT